MGNLAKISLIVLTLVPHTYAADTSVQSAADMLLGSVAATNGSSDTATAMPDYLKSSDSFTLRLFNEWKAQATLPYDVNIWILKTLKKDYAGAAHLWSVIEQKLPLSFQNQAIATHLYDLWKLGTAQTFFNEWVQRLSNENFLESKMTKALEQLISPNFDQWLINQAIIATPEQEAVLKKLNNTSEVYLTIKAWLSLRSGENALTALTSLTPNNLFTIPLAQTAALALAKKNDLVGAAKILKQYAEPAIAIQNNSTILARHNLQIARLLYQAGSLEAAEQFYEKIPRGSADFIKAREELSWVLLRTGEREKLRGELITLSSPLFENQFAPEVYVARAISNLKLCFYEKVEKDFKDFQKIYVPWTRKINNALNTQDPLPPYQPDYFSKQAELALVKRQEEVKKLDELAYQSITAVLPAVGPQAHWERAKKHVLANVETAKKLQSQEYRRQWENQLASLTEAIKKMNFVKVELLSEMRSLEKQVTPEGQIKLSDDILTSHSATVQKQPEQIVFPFDGVMWPDELFKLRSLTNGRCMQRGEK